MELLNLLRQKVLGFGSPRSTIVAVILFIVGAAAIFLGYQFSSSLMIFLGSMGGFFWFVALDALWVSRAPATVRTRLDLHAGRPLFQRRIIAGGIIILWFILVVVFGSTLRDIEAPISASAASGGALESPLIGALTVVVFLLAFRVGSSTASERALEEDVYNEWIMRQQSKRKKTKRSFRRKRKNAQEGEIDEIDEIDEIEEIEDYVEYQDPDDYNDADRPRGGIPSPPGYDN